MTNYLRKILVILLAVASCFNTATAQVCFSQLCDCHEKNEQKLEKKISCHSEVDGDSHEESVVTISALCPCCKYVELGVLKDYNLPQIALPLKKEMVFSTLYFTHYVFHYSLNLPTFKLKPPIV